jgi:hypothetical protein
VDNASFESFPAGGDSLLACVEKHRKLPVEAFVQAVARDLFPGENHPDDLTLLALELGE